jgi:hypothetical protein
VFLADCTDGGVGRTDALKMRDNPKQWDGLHRRIRAERAQLNWSPGADVDSR